MLGHNLTKGPMMIVLEYMPEGDLKQYLESCKGTGHDVLDTKDMINIALDVAQGTCPCGFLWLITHRNGALGVNKLRSQVQPAS